ncbi:MAG: C_GCAxxG_C_C family protein [Deltaproteobacteria bacterium]|nr:C_GCAxxG_C_C family protein [Deltaproteobacteria bacterium]
MIIKEQEFEKMIEKATELAYKYELKYFGCSQTTVAGLVEAFGIGGPDLLRASTCLAGGVARRGHICGALTGGLMLIGYLTGRDDLEMFPQYQRAMDYGNLCYQRFHEEFGTVSCSEIQKLKFGQTFDLQDPEEREELHKKMAEIEDGCQSVTSAGARIAAEIIVDILKQGIPLAIMLAQGK